MLELWRASGDEVNAYVLAGGRAALLPFGSLEAHGPHLPLSTDTVIAEHVAMALAERLDAALLPAIGFGETWLTAGYPGTISLAPATVTAIAMDLARSAHAVGLDRMVVVNGDFGNRAPLDAAARALAGEGIRMLVLNFPGIEDASQAVRTSASASPGLAHADEIETSLVLAAVPELVRPDVAKANYPQFPVDFGLRPIQLHQITEVAVFGDPSQASAAKGEAIMTAIIEAAAAQVSRYLAG